MSTMYILCGLPGSGKDTWIKNNKKNDWLVVSGDDIRTMLNHGTYTYDITVDNLIYDIMYKTIKILMKSKRGIVVNESLITYKKIDRYMLSLFATRNCYDSMVIYINTSKEECLRRRKIDNKGLCADVWKYELNRHSELLEVPIQCEENVEYVQHLE